MQYERSEWGWVWGRGFTGCGGYGWDGAEGGYRPIRPANGDRGWQKRDAVTDDITCAISVWYLA